jgi:hypothetical protein
VAQLRLIPDGKDKSRKNDTQLYKREPGLSRLEEPDSLFFFGICAKEKSRAAMCNPAFELELRLDQKLIFRIFPLLPTNHPASGFANATAQ